MKTNPTAIEGGTVTLTVPSDSVVRKEGRDGDPFYLARLPEGTRVGDNDLSGGLICSTTAHESRRRTGLTELELPADTTKTVKLWTRDQGKRTLKTVRVSARELCKAAADALARARDLAILRNATALLEKGDMEAAREALRVILDGAPGEGILPPKAAASTPSMQQMSRFDPVRAYEAMGILPAWQPLCSANTHSPTETVPERFSYVAIDQGRCVTRKHFNELLATARSRPPRHGGVLEEHSIGYLAKQLAHPFARSRARAIADVYGIGIDVTPYVVPIPGSPLSHQAEEAPIREVVDLGAASISIDSLALVERLGMTPDEADATMEWLQARFESDLALATGRIGLAHVSALLRSPDAAQMLVEAGVRLENPRTGEWIARDPETSEINCAFRESAEPTDDEQALFDWHFLRIASDNGWRVAAKDTLELLAATDGPLDNLLSRAREAYLKDDWLTPRARIENTPTRESAERVLSSRDVPATSSPSYNLRDECHDSVVAGSAHQKTTSPVPERTV